MTLRKALAIAALTFSFIVISMGAYTRLADAGLGCPDWPGCYGFFTVPSTDIDIANAEKNYPQAHPVIAEKAWPEMIHRYLAASLGLLVIATAALHILHKEQKRISVSLIALILFQGALGLWTVTLRLHPLIVMLHLLGGFTTAILLMRLILGKRVTKSRYDKWAIGIFVLLFIQVFLGGWTSANYASLICPDFPTCQGSLLPSMSFSQAFNFMLPFDTDYEFGTLDNIARVTIHMSHRYFATIVTFSMITFLMIAYHLRLAPAKILITLFVQLICQIALGIMNIIYLMPYFVAVAHNIFGLLILLTWTWLQHALKDPN